MYNKEEEVTPDPNTDMHNFVQLYLSMGVVVQAVIYNHEDDDLGTICYKILIDNTVDDRIIGYRGFLTEVFFDENQKFLGQGVWE